MVLKLLREISLFNAHVLVFVQFSNKTQLEIGRNWGIFNTVKFLFAIVSKQLLDIRRPYKGHLFLSVFQGRV